MTLVEQLRVLTHAEHMSQDELDTVYAAIRYIEMMERIAYSPETLQVLLDQVNRLQR